MFASEVRRVGEVSLPTYSGVRVMMLPVRMDDPKTVPMPQWRDAFARIVSLAPVKAGVGYLTIDEAYVSEGETHRRPGLHVDGIGPDGREAGWGGGGKYGSSGMLLASNVVGCVGWHQNVAGYPGPNGDCEPLRTKLDPKRALVMQPGGVYFCGPLGVHEGLPMRHGSLRTLVRLSMPNDCPWYEGYTRNPLGVEPTGPIHAKRVEFMRYRESTIGVPKMTPIRK